MKYVLILFSVLCANSLSAQQYERLNLHVETDLVSEDQRRLDYLLGDGVLFRSGPGKEHEVIDQLAIGTALKTLSAAPKLDTINGIISQWYKVDVNSRIGYVWGGFIAQHTSGSHRDGAIRFAIGLEKVVTEPTVDRFSGEVSDQRQVYTQIRAYKDHVLLDKISIKSYRAFHITPHSMYDGGLYTGNKGGLGLTNVHDVIKLYAICESCGCTAVESYTVWNGKAFTHLTTAYSTVDAGYSEGEEYIFPSDSRGEPGFIIKSINKIIFDDTEDDSLRQDKRERYKEYYIWNGESLAKTMKRTVSVITNLDD